ncbi:hypothetical protein N657DRAFT_160776 [Parathielavia appendiculata]|uniref:Uncharacterized protein n=1 Tax=Parathielavia appendiculata TaxID=2587402 RepID=A0AAN6TUG5_9PEZI|nr:hypothetical protein N657DRAFT_160776 [Parathielavia appendiculata]
MVLHLFGTDGPRASLGKYSRIGKRSRLEGTGGFIPTYALLSEEKSRVLTLFVTVLVSTRPEKTNVAVLVFMLSAGPDGNGNSFKLSL